MQTREGLAATLTYGLMCWKVSAENLGVPIPKLVISCEEMTLKKQVHE